MTNVKTIESCPGQDGVMKVTEHTFRGPRTVYYRMYRDNCFTPGALLVGALGIKEVCHFLPRGKECNLKYFSQEEFC